LQISVIAEINVQMFSQFGGCANARMVARFILRGHNKARALKIPRIFRILTALDMHLSRSARLCSAMVDHAVNIDARKKTLAVQQLMT
jgi:hypothetical protein